MASYDWVYRVYGSRGVLYVFLNLVVRRTTSYEE